MSIQNDSGRLCDNLAQKKRRQTIQDLNAFATAYGNAIGRREYINDILLPGLVLAILGSLTAKWYAILIMFVIGAMFGRFVLMPRDVQRSYENASLAERGRFMLAAAQISTNTEKTMLMVLREATDRLNHNGELYKEFSRLCARLSLLDVSAVTVQPQFRYLLDKYSDDVNFCLFLEQLETGVINGNSQPEVLIEVERYHKNMRFMRDNFMNMKNSRLNDLKMNTVFSWFVVATLVMVFGIKKYMFLLNTYPVTQIANIAFILSQCMIFTRFNTVYWDDDITSIGDVKNKEAKANARKVELARKKELAEKKKAMKASKKKGLQQREAAENLADAYQKDKVQSIAPEKSTRKTQAKVSKQTTMQTKATSAKINPKKNVKPKVDSAKADVKTASVKPKKVGVK